MISSISEITQLWDRTLSKIEKKLDDKQFCEAFFSGSYINEIKGDKVIVIAKNLSGLTLMQSKYNELFTETFNELAEGNFTLEFISENEVKKGIQQKNIVVEQPKQSFFTSSSLNVTLTFDSFVAGVFNKDAYNAAKLVASQPGKMFNPLFIYSQSGLGKTHLLHAIGNYIKSASKRDAKILYIQASDFVDEYIRSVKGEKDAELLKDYICSFDVLLLDDVQMLANKVNSQDFFFSVYEKLNNAGKQIVITSDKQPSELNGMQDRIITRFSRGLTVKINDPDQNTCVEILRKKIVERGLDLNRIDDSALCFFADKFSMNIRELEGALNGLIFAMMSLDENQRVTLDIAIESARSIIGGKTLANEMSEQRIINIVSDYYNLTPSQLTGTVRTGQIALARHIAMYLIRNTLDVPLKKIGDVFGGKDHTTVMNAIQKVDKGLKTDMALKEAVEELQKRLKP